MFENTSCSFHVNRLPLNVRVLIQLSLKNDPVDVSLESGALFGTYVPMYLTRWQMPMVIIKK